MAARHHKGKKGEWLRRLRLKDQQPLMQILEVVMGEQTALEKEQKWIRHFLAQKMPLFNAQTQPTPSTKALAPLRQETVILLGYPLIVVQLPNEDIAISLQSLCNMLKVERNMQIKRIRNDEVLLKQLAQVILQTPGGPQVSAVLTDWAVPIWASGLNISRLPENKQTLALVLQQEAIAAVEYAFTRPETNASATEVHTHRSPQSIIAQIRQQFSRSSEGDLKGVVTALESKPTTSIIGFSPQRLSHIYLLAYRLRQRHHMPIAETLAGLADHFRVADVFDLPEKEWPTILDWFSSLLEDW